MLLPLASIVACLAAGALRAGAFREDLATLIEGSARKIPTAEHRMLHQEASGSVRWGRRGGRRTLALYGRPYFSLLSSFRWGRVELEALIQHGAGMHRQRSSAKPEVLR